MPYNEKSQNFQMTYDWAKRCTNTWALKWLIWKIHISYHFFKNMSQKPLRKHQDFSQKAHSTPPFSLTTGPNRVLFRSIFTRKLFSFRWLTQKNFNFISLSAPRQNVQNPAYKGSHSRGKLIFIFQNITIVFPSKNAPGSPLWGRQSSRYHRDVFIGHFTCYFGGQM